MEGDGRDTLINGQWKRTQKFFRNEFLRYVISGCIAFIFDFSILVIGTEVLGFHYLVSNIGGYTAGLVLSYSINIKWVFRKRRFAANQRIEFVYFTLIVFAGLILSEAILYITTELGNQHYTFSKIVATFFVFLFNFIIKKRFLFS